MGQRRGAEKLLIARVWHDGDDLRASVTTVADVATAPPVVTYASGVDKIRCLVTDWLAQLHDHTRGSS